MTYLATSLAGTVSILDWHAESLHERSCGPTESLLSWYQRVSMVGVHGPFVEVDEYRRRGAVQDEAGAFAVSEWFTASISSGGLPVR